MTSFIILQRVALTIGKFSKAVKFEIMEYQGGSSQNSYNYHKVQLTNTSYDPNNYFASSMSSHVDVASHNDTRYVASVDTFNNVPHHTHHN